MSRSFGVRPSGASRTAPPATKARYPSRTSASRMWRSGSPTGMSGGWGWVISRLDRGDIAEGEMEALLSMTLWHHVQRKVGADAVVDRQEGHANVSMHGDCCGESDEGSSDAEAEIGVQQRHLVRPLEE